MRRFTEKQYSRQIVLPAFAYVLATLLIWPVAVSASSVWLKLALIGVQLAPMLYILILLARLIARSDELEQRTHLIGLGVATAVLAVLSLVGGSLSFVGLITLDGSVLLWVFPLLMVSYQLARSWVTRRRYGGSDDCVSAGLQTHQRLTLAGLMALIAASWWWRGRIDWTALGMFCGIGAVWLVMELIARARRRRSAASAR